MLPPSVPLFPFCRPCKCAPHSEGPLVRRRMWRKGGRRVTHSPLCCSRSTHHVTYSGVGGSKGVAPFKVHLNTLMCYIMGFLPLYGFTNMINCIFLECSFYYPQDDFNITYSRRKCAQACLDRSAPCLGLSVYFIGSTVQTIYHRLVFCKCENLKIRCLVF